MKIQLSDLARLHEVADKLLPSLQPGIPASRCGCIVGARTFGGASLQQPTLITSCTRIGTRCDYSYTVVALSECELCRAHLRVHAIHRS